MIRYKKFSTNLKNYIQNNNLYRDTSILSTDYFRLYDLNDHMKLGRNSFRINANINTLIQGSSVYIDLIDTNGNPIYFKLIDVKLEDRSSLVSIEIYDTTPKGIAKLYIAGRAMVINGVYQKYTNSDLDIPNVYYTHNINIVPNLPTDDEIIHVNQPNVSVSVHTNTIKIIDGSQIRSTTIDESTGAILTIIPYNDTNINGNVNIMSDIIDDESENININNTYSLLRSNIPLFNDDMVGGILTVNNIINILLNLVNNSVEGEILLKYIQSNNIQDYNKFVIVKLIDSKSVIISDKYELKFTHDKINYSYDVLRPITDWSIMYNTSDLILIDGPDRSFAKFNLHNITPVSGNISNVEIYYSLYENISSYELLGKFSLLDPQSVLTTHNIVPGKTSLKYESAWKFDTDLNTSDCWDIEGLTVTESEKYIRHYKMNVYSDNATLILKPDASIHFKENTVYLIDTETFRNSSKCDINIYVEGNKIQTEYDLQSVDKIIDNIPGYTHVGSIDHSESGTVNTKIYFKCTQSFDGKIILKFKNYDNLPIEIDFKYFDVIIANEIGFSPNYYELIFPIELFQLNKEMLFRVKYLNDYNEYSKIQTDIDGVIFNGSLAALEIPLSSFEGYDELITLINNNYNTLNNNKIGGSGSAGFVARFSGFKSITNTSIFQNGPDIGIGTITPTNTLHISGSLRVTDTTGSDDISSFAMFNTNGKLTKLLYHDTVIPLHMLSASSDLYNIIVDKFDLINLDNKFNKIKSSDHKYTEYTNKNFTGRQVYLKKTNIKDITIYVNGSVFNNYKLFNSKLQFNTKLINCDLYIKYR